MNFIPLKIAGAYLIKQEPHTDERGEFARQFCKNELAQVGLDFDIKQCNISKNFKAGVLRGLHYQKEPYPEIKLVSCFKGAIYDVIVDIRPNSPTYLQWLAVELTEKSNTTIYIPAGIAHGFQTLIDDSIVYYQLGEFFNPSYYAGIRWDDPKINIKWPECNSRIINSRDASYDFLP